MRLPLSAPRTRVFLTAALLAAALHCSAPEEPSVESVDGGSSTPLALSLQSLTGARDGGLLRARAIFEGEAGNLTLDLEFALGVPTRLSSGTYESQILGAREKGEVAAKSVTFLGGQSDRPNLGGVFTLLSEAGAERYRVRVPTRPVNRRERP